MPLKIQKLIIFIFIMQNMDAILHLQKDFKK